MADVFKGRKSAIYADNWLTQTLQAERQRRDEVVEGERGKLRVHIEREVIDPLIDTSKKHFGIREAIDSLREALTQPPTPLTNDLAVIKRKE